MSQSAGRIYKGSQKQSDGQSRREGARLFRNQRDDLFCVTDEREPKNRESGKKKVSLCSDPRDGCIRTREEPF